MKAEQLRAFALSLPETTEEPHFDYTSFRVKSKIFVTMPPGEVHAHIFVDDETREQTVEMYPEFSETLMWGKRAAGIRITLTKAKSPIVKDLVKAAWTRKAPKSLLKAAV